MYTRKQYMQKEVTHHEYYSQFVDDQVLSLVRECIGMRDIKASKDPHMNDIPLQRWDSMYPELRYLKAQQMLVADPGGMSLSDGVCIAKAAARILKEKDD